METVLEEVAQEFNGEDPLLPIVRKTLDEMASPGTKLPVGHACWRLVGQAG